MLAVVMLLASSFTFLIWNSYRTARLRAAQQDDADAPSASTVSEGS